MTGKTYTSFRTQQKKERPFRIIKIGLTGGSMMYVDAVCKGIDDIPFDRRCRYTPAHAAQIRNKKLVSWKRRYLPISVPSYRKPARNRHSP